MVIRIIRINSEYSISEIREKGSMKSYKHFIADCYDFDTSRDIIASVMKDVGNPQMFGILLEIRNEVYDEETKSINTGDKVTSVFINVSKIRSRRCTNEKIVRELVLHEFDKIRTTYNFIGDGEENILAKATIPFNSFNDLYEGLKWMDLTIEKAFEWANCSDVLFESKEHQKIYREIVEHPYPYTFESGKLTEEDKHELLSLRGEAEWKSNQESL